MSKKKYKKKKHTSKKLLIGCVLILIALGGIAFVLWNSFFTPTPQSQSVADFPFKKIESDKIADFCPYVRRYNAGWLETPIRQDKEFGCYDFCDPTLFDKAKSAYDSKETEDSTRKRIDAYTDGSDESEGQGGKFFGSIAACEDDLLGSKREPVKNAGTNCGPVDLPELGYQICTEKPPKGDNPPGTVVDNMPWVTVKFTRLPELAEGRNFYFCTKSNANDCRKDDWKKVDDPYILRDGGLIVCGDGANALKSAVKKRDGKDFGNNCDSLGRDWFHTGKRYYVFVAQGISNDLRPSDVVAAAQFPVFHFYPEVVAPKEEAAAWLNMQNLGQAPIKDLTVTLKGRNTKSRADSSQYNDYYLEVVSQTSNYKTEGKCLYVPPTNLSAPDTSTGTQKIPLAPYTADLRTGVRTPLTQGVYVLRIKEGVSGNYFSDPTKTICSDGGFTLYEIPFRISNTASTEPPVNGRASTAGGIGPAIQDPYDKESELTNILPIAPATVCSKVDENGLCTEINTALGPINTQPEQFVKSILEIILGLAGVITVLFFIQAGYRLMTSAGNKEKVAQAREQITAAIMGLIFIVLSIALLEFIGFNILRLPGFGSTPAAPQTTIIPTVPFGGLENDPDLRPQDTIPNP